MAACTPILARNRLICTAECDCEDCGRQKASYARKTNLLLSNNWNMPNVWPFIDILHFHVIDSLV